MATSITANRGGRRLGAVIVVGAILLGLGFAAFSAFDLGWPDFIGGRPYQEVGPTVIESIQELSELTSVEMVEYTTIEKGNDRGILNFLAGDRIFMFAVARIGAGVDLGKLGAGSFVVDQETGTVLVNLPAAEVFYSYLDVEATQVVDRDTGLLVKGDAQLESEARREAESILLEQALARGILDMARENAEDTVAGFLHGLGFEHVVIERSLAP